MAKMLWYNTVTIDDFVAGTADGMSWITPYFGADDIVAEVLPRSARYPWVPEPSAGSWPRRRQSRTGGQSRLPSKAPPGFTFGGGEITDTVEEWGRSLVISTCCDSRPTG